MWLTVGNVSVYSSSWSHQLNLTFFLFEGLARLGAPLFEPPLQMQRWVGCRGGQDKVRQCPAICEVRRSLTGGMRPKLIFLFRRSMVKRHCCHCWLWLRHPPCGMCVVLITINKENMFYVVWFYSSPYPQFNAEVMFFQHQYIYSVPISIPPLIVYPCDIFYLVPLILLYKWLVISLGKLWHFQICLISFFGNVFTPYLVYIRKAILAVMGWAAKTVVGGLYIRMREICPTMVSFFPCIIC